MGTMHGRGRAARGVGVAMALTALGLAGPTQASAQEGALRTIDETRQVDGDVPVEVDVITRTVHVTAWDRSEVRVRGSMNPELEEFTFEVDGGGVRIELEAIDDHGYRSGELGDVGELTITVPRGASLEVELVNGELTVEDVEGAVELETVNGPVRYTGNARSVAAEAVNGRVEVRAPRAEEARAGSVSGDVSLHVGGGVVEGESVSGNVEIRASGPVRRASADAVSGDLTFVGGPASNGSLHFESHSGAVLLRLPAGLDAVLEAETFSGGIESAFGGEVVRESQYTPGKSFRHTVGSGGARVSAETFSGTVRFLRSGS